MTVHFVDSNIFLRFLTRDDPKKASRCRLLFERAINGHIQLETNYLVLAEIIWTLESYYLFNKNKIIPMIESLLNTPNLEIQGADLIAQTMAIWSLENIDFIDSFNAAYMKNREIENIFSYDKDYDKIDILKRLEP